MGAAGGADACCVPCWGSLCTHPRRPAATAQHAPSLPSAGWSSPGRDRTRGRVRRLWGWLGVGPTRASLQLQHTTGLASRRAMIQSITWSAANGVLGRLHSEMHARLHRTVHRGGTLWARATPRRYPVGCLSPGSRTASGSHRAARHRWVLQRTR